MACCNPQVRYTGAREKSPEERRERFVEDLKQGHSVIVSSRPGDVLVWCGIYIYGFDIKRDQREQYGSSTLVMRLRVTFRM